MGFCESNEEEMMCLCERDMNPASLRRLHLRNTRWNRCFFHAHSTKDPLRLSRNASAGFSTETFGVLLAGNTANNWIDLTERHKPDQFNRCQAQTSDLWRDILVRRQRLSEQMTQSREPGTDKWRSKRTCQRIERLAARPTPTSTRPIPADPGHASHKNG